MHGCYLTSDTPRIASAGFVLARGWAHEAAHERGITEALLRALVGPAGNFDRIRIALDVDAVGSTVVLHGQPSDLDLAFVAIRRRILGADLFPVPVGNSTAAVAAFDGDALWKRWGARSFGLQALTRYALRAPDPQRIDELRTQVNALTVVPFGVNSVSARVLEDLPEDVTPPEPANEPIITTPAHLVADGATFAWTFQPEDRLADEILVQALASCFVAPTPEQGAIRAFRRRLGAAGEHTTTRLLARGPHTNEMAAAAQQLRRLHDGPSEAELVAALDALHARPGQDALGEAMLRAWRNAGLSASPATERPGGPTTASVADASHALRRLLDTMLVIAPSNDALADVTPLRESPVDRTSIGGRPFQAGLITTAGAGLAGARLIVGERGASVVRRGRSRGHTTVQPDDISAIELWADGERSVLSRYGYRLEVDPLDWRRGAKACAAVDAIAPSRVVETAQRHPGVTSALPGPRFVDWARFAPIVLSVLLGLLLLAILRLSTAPDLTRQERLIGAVIIAVLGGAAVVYSGLIARSVRRRQRRATGSTP